MSMACRKTHRLDVPPSTTSWARYTPREVVNSTQQSPMAVRRTVTGPARCCPGIGVAPSRGAPVRAVSSSRVGPMVPGRDDGGAAEVEQARYHLVPVTSPAHCHREIEQKRMQLMIDALKAAAAAWPASGLCTRVAMRCPSQCLTMVNLSRREGIRDHQQPS